MNVAGMLNNLCLEIEEERGSWHAFSSHLVTLAAIAVDRRSKSASQSVTPSPQKQQKVTKPTLYSWTLRLCQVIDCKGKPAGDDSDTESEGESDSHSALQTTAWYAARFNLSQSQALLKESGESLWETLELRVRFAWDGGNVDVMGQNDKRAKDGTYSSVKLAFDTTDVDKEENDDQKAKIEVLLHRLSSPDDILAASLVCIDLAKDFNKLKSQTKSLKEERDGHRKLLQNNRRHERFKEANSSLFNPGRLKRKTQDDEGFEGDEEEEEEK